MDVVPIQVTDTLHYNNDITATHRIHTARCNIHTVIATVYNEMPYAATLCIITYAMSRHNGELPRLGYTVALVVIFMSACASAAFVMRQVFEVVHTLCTAGIVVVAISCCDDRVFGEHVMLLMYALLVRLRSPTLSIRIFQASTMIICATVLAIFSYAQWYVAAFGIMSACLMRPRRHPNSLFREEGTIPDAMHQSLNTYLFDMSEGRLHPHQTAVATLTMTNRGEWVVCQKNQRFVDLFVGDIVERQDPLILSGITLLDVIHLCIGFATFAM